MIEKLIFNSHSEFIHKLEELLKSGISPKKLKVYLPFPDHEVDHLLDRYDKPSKLKFFTLAGALTGLLTGFGFTIYTSLSWPLRTSAKPIVSLPAYVVIAFELTILIGAIVSFVGFLILSRSPSFKRILSPEEYGNQFVILIDREDR